MAQQEMDQYNEDGMTFGVDVASEGQEEGTKQDQTGEEKPFDFPHVQDALTYIKETLTDSVSDFEQHEHYKNESFGSKKYHHELKMALHSAKLVQTHLDAAKVSYGTLSGNRSRSQRKGDEKKSLNHAARNFFEKLSTPALRVQCQLHNVDFDSYESIESVVDVLVEKSLAIASNGHDL